MNQVPDERGGEMRDLFFETAQELLQSLNDDALKLEKTPKDPEIIRSIRRTVHTLKGDAAAHRPILAEYSEGFLDQMVAVVTASTVTAYALYTMSPETVAKFHTHLLPATLPFVLYGIFRYLYLLYSKQLGGNPSELFLNDGPLLVNTFLWFLVVLAIVYGPAVR